VFYVRKAPNAQALVHITSTMRRVCTDARGVVRRCTPHPPSSTVGVDGPRSLMAYRVPFDVKRIQTDTVWKSCVHGVGDIWGTYLKAKGFRHQRISGTVSTPYPCRFPRKLQSNVVTVASENSLHCEFHSSFVAYRKLVKTFAKHYPLHHLGLHQTRARAHIHKYTRILSTVIAVPTLFQYSEFGHQSLRKPPTKCRTFS